MSVAPLIDKSALFRELTDISFGLMTLYGKQLEAGEKGKVTSINNDATAEKCKQFLEYIQSFKGSANAFRQRIKHARFFDIQIERNGPGSMIDWFSVPERFREAEGNLEKVDEENEKLEMLSAQLKLAMISINRRR